MPDEMKKCPGSTNEFVECEVHRVKESAGLELNKPNELNKLRGSGRSGKAKSQIGQEKAFNYQLSAIVR